MMRALILTAALSLAACATPAPAPEPGAPAWQCNAEDAQSLIGSHFGAITFPADANVRFVCTECAMTRDFRPDRLTILYDQDSGIVEEVRCV